MVVAYRKVKIGRSDKQIKSIAVTLYRSNCDAFLMEKIDPFAYLKGLKKYGIKAKAKPLKLEKLIVGYKFSKN